MDTGLHRGEGHTILVVDDERPILDLIRSFLGPKGIECVTTTDPREALDLLARRSFDLVVTDIHMQGLDGVELLERVREIDGGALVILMTGQPSVDTAVRSLKANAYDYVTKPFDLEEFLDVVDRALEKRRLERENTALKDTLTLYQISQAVNAAVDEREIVDMVLRSVEKELEADSVTLFVGESAQGLERWNGGNGSGPLAALEKRIAVEASSRREPLVLPDGNARGSEFPGGLARTAVAIPLGGRDGLLGVLMAIRREGRRDFDRGDLQAMTILAGNVAAVMDNARQTRLVMESRAGLVEANAATIGALVSALDAREHETQVHSIRVTEYALRLAREIDFPASEIVDLRFGAILHDIGKIGISDRILLKPGPLTEDEWREMRRHPRIGHDILRDIGFLSKASEIVLAHHERWDGKGYPKGLAGEEIPLGARLFSIADTLDSMTMDRPYRRALGFDDVVAAVERGRGSQYEPRIVDAFLPIPRGEWERIAAEAQKSPFPGVPIHAA